MTETQTEAQPEAAREPIPHTVKEETRKPGSLLVLSVEVPEEVVTGRVEGVLDDFKREAVIPGFRKGKAPMDLVRRRLGKAARGEAVQRVIPQVCEQIIDEKKVNQLAEPRLENVKSEAGEPVSFDLVLEVRPEINLPPLKDISVNVEQTGVTDQLIEQQLEHIRRRNAILTDKETEAVEGDQVIIDITVTDHEGKDVPQLAGNDLVIRTGEESQGLPEEVVKSVIGQKPGDTVSVGQKRSIHVHPEEGEHRDEEVTWTYNLSIKEVKSVQLPDLDDEFAKDVGDFDSLDALRTRIREDLETSEDSRQRDAAVSAALQEILNRVSFDAPASLVAQQQYRTLARDHQYLQAMNMTFADLGQEKDQYLASTMREAEQRVRAELVLAEIGQQAQLQVTEEDINAEIERLAAEAGRKPLAIRAQIEAKKQMGALQDQIARKKIADHLLSQVKVNYTAAAAEPEGGEAKPKKKPRKKAE